MRIATLSLFLAVFLGISQGQFIQEKAFKLPAGLALVNLLAKGDFNHDNKLDVLVSARNASNQPELVVFPGLGGGGFGAPVVTEVTGLNTPVILAVGDLNGDGIPDAVITGTNPITGVKDIGVMLADGTGKFEAPKLFRSPLSTLGLIVVDDFTGDKKADLAVLTSPVTVFPGNGDGTFGTPVSSTYAASAQCAATADFNRDGNLDITTGSFVLLGNGDGTFKSPLTVVNGFCDVAVGDFNKDGIPDLVTAAARISSPGVRVFLGDGTGKFKTSTVYGTGDNAGEALSHGFAVDTFNGDTNLDIAVLNPRDDDVTMLLGKGDGTFTAGGSFAVASDSGVFSGDFNGDHKTDLAVTTEVGLSVLLGKGNGTFTAVTAQNFPPTGDIRLADVNGDHKPDLIEFGEGNVTGISVRLGNGDGTFGNPSGLPNGCASKLVGVVSDFNGDKTPDVAFLPTSGGGIGICLGNGNGTFKDAVMYDEGVQHGIVLAGDFNHDGKLDLVASDVGGFSVLPGNGDGTFSSAVLTALSNFSTFTTGDFNHDGKLDIAALLNTGDIAVLLGRGDGTFQAPVTSSNPNGSLMILAGDLNNDGKLDLVTGGPGTGVNTLLGNGDGTFQAPLFRALATPNSAQLRDLNGDGNLDLVVIAGGFVDVLLGNGNGTFQATKNFVAAGHGFMAIADLNGDGLLDLVDLHSQYGKGGTFTYINQGR